MCELASKLHITTSKSINTKNQNIKNLVTRAQVDEKASQFLPNVISVGESAYAKFRKSRITENSGQIFNNIPKTRIPTAFMQNIDYARPRDHSITNLSKTEITSASFCLIKDDFLQKHQNSELATEVKEPFRKE